jgi:putative component of toxin-antitoxin plasmid stabilization module
MVRYSECPGGSQGAHGGCPDGNGEPVQHRTVGSGVSECKIDFGPGYRVYFGKVGMQLIIFLGGGIKKRQQQDIEAAQERWTVYKARKRKER